MPLMMLMGSSGTWASSSLRRSCFQVPQHGFTFTLRGRGWSALTTRPPWSSRLRCLPDSLTFEVLPRLVRLQVGETLGLPPRVLHLIFKDALRCMRLVEVVLARFVSAEAVPSVAGSSRELPLMGFSKTIPPSTCAPGVHSHPSSRQAVSLGLGQGLPAPRLVPSLPFLTTSTGFSSWRVAGLLRPAANPGIHHVSGGPDALECSALALPSSLSRPIRCGFSGLLVVNAQSLDCALTPSCARVRLRRPKSSPPHLCGPDSPVSTEVSTCASWLHLAASASTEVDTRAAGWPLGSEHRPESCPLPRDSLRCARSARRRSVHRTDSQGLPLASHRPPLQRRRCSTGRPSCCRVATSARGCRCHHRVSLRCGLTVAFATTSPTGA
jgi:hypothetical protein